MPKGKAHEPKSRENKQPPRLDRRLYEKELSRLQAELVSMQEWVRAEKARIVVIFEGRDAAGKGSAIKRVTQYLNPRVARIFCTPDEYRRFLAQCPVYERLLTDDGLLLRKYWFSVSDDEQERRFRSRLDDPMRQWKLSPMDLESIRRWEDYSRAKDEMFVHTDTSDAPWYVVEADDKRRARINMIAYLLSTIPYHKVPPSSIELPARPTAANYIRPPRDLYRSVPDHAASLEQH